MNDAQRVRLLFDRFGKIYGKRWKGGSANQWAKGIDGLTEPEIARGIDQARKSCEWPPNIAEFRKLAKPPDDQHPAQAVHVAQPRKQVDRQGAEKALKRIREALGGKK